MPLSAADELTISGLRRSHVEITTSNLKQFFRRSMWVGKTNRYSLNVTEQIRDDLSGNALNRLNLAQYISASAALHINDGWSYLGRAISCLLVGDAHRAVHLGYYAELRAAMALLASGGIGIFRNRHFVINGPRTAERLEFEKQTHDAAWAFLEFWSRQSPSGSLFTKIVRPAGRSLDDWFQWVGGGATLAAQAQGWFLQWGMDLSLVTKDRDARNESSYRPDGIPSAWALSPEGALDFVTDLWTALEPSTPSSFEHIDRHILRLALEAYFKGTWNKRPSNGDPDFEGFMSFQGLSTPAEKWWRDFLLRTTSPTNPAIFDYSKCPLGASGGDHFSLISRAVLLLRVATGSAQDLLQEAGVNSETLSFWWQAIGEARGLWPSETPPEDLSDLWADVREALSDVEAFGSAAAASPQSINDLGSYIGGSLRALCSHERVGLWGLCPA